jgi:hypothetical protein
VGFFSERDEKVHPSIERGKLQEMYQALLRDAAEAREAHQRLSTLRRQRNAHTALATSEDEDAASGELEHTRRMATALEKLLSDLSHVADTEWTARLRQEWLQWRDRYTRLNDKTWDYDVVTKQIKTALGAGGEN